MRKSLRSGFTLVELLVVIGIIAVLISILLPALQRARDSSATIKCSANLRSIGQGLLAYAAENKQYLPVAFNYRGTVVDYTTGKQTPTSAVYGFVHWSSLLYGGGQITPEAFQCPSLTNGGLPPNDPPPGGWDSGQVGDSTNVGTGGVTPDGRITAVTAIDGTGASVTYFPDSQAPRLAYVLNDSVVGWNKYVVGFQDANAVRVYRNVSLNQIENQSSTILGTEFVDEWGIASGVNRGSGSGVNAKANRPVTPWRTSNGGANTVGDADKSTTAVAYLVDAPTTTLLRKSNAGDLWRIAGGAQSLDIVKDYQGGNYSPVTRGSRLDFVGRNHGYGEKPADKKSNFLYVDGHVETKSILETIPKDSTVGTPWEWGAKPYALSPAALDPAIP